MESKSMRPFCRMSSILNQGIAPFSQYAAFAFEGVYPFLMSNNSLIFTQVTLCVPPPILANVNNLFL